MIDVLWEARQKIIENFQLSMRSLRLLMGYSIAELAEYVGVTRQTINNLETGKSKMTAMQFLSLAAVVDNYISSNGDMYQAIEAILDGNGKKTAGVYDTSFSGFSLLRRWFLLFDGALGLELSAAANNGDLPDEANIQKLVRGYKIFLDDTALCAEKAEKFIASLVDHLNGANEKLIIPFRAIEQVQEYVQNAARSQHAVQALKLVNWMQQKKIAEIRGEESDSALHDTILSVFAKFRSLHRLCLITQDRTFANEVLWLNTPDNHQGFNIVAGSINEDGKLVLYGSGSKDSLPKVKAPAPLIGAESVSPGNTSQKKENANTLESWTNL